jgi:hypothetical protein
VSEFTVTNDVRDASSTEPVVATRCWYEPHERQNRDHRSRNQKWSWLVLVLTGKGAHGDGLPFYLL